MVTKNSKPENVAEEKVEKLEKLVEKHFDGGNWIVGKIFWGLLFVLIGGLVLANNFGFVSVNWSNLWRLWPLIIIATGFSILALRNLIWRIITIILIVLAMAAIAWVAVGGFSIPSTLKSQEMSIQKTADTVKQAEISVKAGASSLVISSAEQSEIVKSRLESNVAIISENSVISGETQQINLTMDSNKANNWWSGDVSSKWNINIARKLPLELNVDTGASDTNIDMSQAQLRNISVKTGASNLILKLGYLEDTTLVNIDSGVSSILLRVPTDSGVQLKLESGLTTKHLADLGEISKDTYESTGYASAKSKINISAKVGVSTFSVERY